jgi:hypothetical protein
MENLSETKTTLTPEAWKPSEEEQALYDWISCLVPFLRHDGKALQSRVLSLLKPADPFAKHELKELQKIMNAFLSELIDLFFKTITLYLETSSSKKTLYFFVSCVGEVLDEIGVTYYASEFESFYLMYDRKVADHER